MSPNVKTPTGREPAGAKAPTIAQRELPADSLPKTPAPSSNAWRLEFFKIARRHYEAREAARLAGVSWTELRDMARRQGEIERRFIEEQRAKEGGDEHA